MNYTTYGRVENAHFENTPVTGEGGLPAKNAPTKSTKLKKELRKPGSQRYRPGVPHGGTTGWGAPWRTPGAGARLRNCD